MAEVTSIEGRGKKTCELVEAFTDLTKELKREGYDEEFIKHALSCLSTVYVSIYTPSVVYSE